jgi:outer membrane protein OmpA-like peptidoglycan-associated protein
MSNEPDRRDDKAGLGPRSVHVEPSARRRPKWLPWLLLAIPLILLLLLARTCQREEAPEAQTTTTTTTAVAPATTGAPLAPMTGMYGELQTYLASAEPAGRRFVFDNLHFATNSAALPADAQQTLGGLAQLLQAYPRATVRIDGYADARGSESANTQLGAQRAQAVVQALAGMGVPADRLSAATGSESNPVAPNTSEQGQAQNRRTELVVVAK